MSKEDWGTQELRGFFWAVFTQCTDLMLKKNHDYGNSWYDDRATTITDTIRHKLDRIRRLEDLRANGEQAEVAEGIESELFDCINYCVFRIIKEREITTVQDS